MYDDIVFRDKTGIVLGTYEVLFDGHVGYIVQVDVLRNIQYGFLDEIRGIKGYIKMPRKTECFRVERNKT